ncbi:seed maturation protein PM31 [Spatholobus suberectus]|nr:seed maturation protein PM31 [Spatholobus suberectus]
MVRVILSFELMVFPSFCRQRQQRPVLKLDSVPLMGLVVLTGTLVVMAVTVMISPLLLLTRTLIGVRLTQLISSVLISLGCGKGPKGASGREKDSADKRGAGEGEGGPKRQMALRREADANINQIEGKLENGVLTLTMPKIETKPKNKNVRQIDVA